MVKAAPNQQTFPFAPPEADSAPINRDKLIRLLQELAVGRAAKNATQKEAAWNVLGHITRDMDAHAIMTLINQSGLTHLVVTKEGELDASRFSNGARIALLQVNRENREAYHAALRAETEHASHVFHPLVIQINIRILVNGTDEAKIGARTYLQKILTDDEIVQQLERLRGPDFPSDKIMDAVAILSY